MSELTRRGFLLGSSAAMVATAGCLGTQAGATETGGVQASFFVVSDFTANVTDGELAVETVVPFGQHGHGWEPGPDVQRAVSNADAFVYVGEGFQPWADKLVRNIRDDGSDVAVIEAWADVELRSGTEDGHDEHEEEHGTHEEEHGTHEEEHGSKDTETEHHDKHEGDHETEHHDKHEKDHDGNDSHASHAGAVDPHYWLDLGRAARSVETIAAGLGDVDPANADTYRANAAAYTDRLAALDATYEERLAGRTRDTVLVAGHNSFQYLAERYGFHVESLVGLAPDASPTPKDVARAQAVIDEHDIEYVLAPVFESDRAATQLVAETDAKAVLPLTPVPTLTEEWRENGWGYLEVMEQVNLPSLARALGAE
ncbi:metal ABC transporter substrate-binding protein [Natronomonas sp. EA1]|uniref:metal ABC transporter substrate-binding protein n=1 Tax=Natronomonas sp. EA1 TaxID=3421655 RepID=UPI003EBC9986